MIIRHPREDTEEGEPVHRGSLTDYARPISAACDYRCSYCGRDMASTLTDFLCGHLEHVVPRYAKRDPGFDRLWVENDCNLVLACSACNCSLTNPVDVKEFLGSVQVPEFPLEFLERHINDPEYLVRSGEFEPFMVIRDRIYDLKEAFVQKRRAAKLVEFEALKAGRSSGKAALDRKWRVAGRTGYRCAYCGRLVSESLNDWLITDLEHVVPRATVRERAYPHDLVEGEDYQVVACHACNIFAHDKRIEDVLSLFEPPVNAGQFRVIFEAVFKRKLEIVREKLLEYTQFFNRRVRRNR